MSTTNGTFEEVIRSKVKETKIPEYDKERFINHIVTRNKKSSYKLPYSIVSMYGHYVYNSPGFSGNKMSNLYIKHLGLMPPRALEDYYEIVRIYGRSF